jgi:hypothetical protein
MPEVRASAVCGVIGIVSGLATPHLSDALRVVLPDWVIIDVPISMWLAGLAFGLALASAFALLLAYAPRQLLIIPFVLIGWFCAVQVCLWSGAQEPKSYAQASPQSGQADRCLRLDGVGGAEQASERECFELVPATAEGDTERHSRYWQSLGAYAAAGAIGALITAFGIPIATRRNPSRLFYVAITLTGTIVAAAWFVLAGAVAMLSADQHWYALFAPWQAAVAAAIGGSINSKAAASQN